MNSWVIAVRGSDEALARARELFGPPAGSVGSVALFEYRAIDPAAAAEALRALCNLGRGSAGALVAVHAMPDGSENVSSRPPEHDPLGSAQQRALALALSAPAGDVLLDRTARDRLGAEAMVSRAGPRTGWSLPFSAMRARRHAPDGATRRALVGTLPLHPPRVARDREVAALAAAGQSGKPIALYAARGAGGTRVIYEAALAARKTLVRLPQAALRADDDSLRAALSVLPPRDWVVIDPLPASSFESISAVLDALPRGRSLVVRIEGNEPIDFVHPTRRIALAPLRRYDALRLLHGLLGWLTPEDVLRRLFHLAGALPRPLVETARAAVSFGELVHDDHAWVLRDDRALRATRRNKDPLVSRLRTLPPGQRDALAIACGLGDGTPETTVRAALRAARAEDPRTLLATLGAGGFLEYADGAVSISSSVDETVATIEADRLADACTRVDALAMSGVLVPAAEGEAASIAGQHSYAAQSFAGAAIAAVQQSLPVVAVRYAAAAREHTRGPLRSDPTVFEALTAVSASLGPVLTVTRTDVAPTTSNARPSVVPRAPAPGARRPSRAPAPAPRPTASSSAGPQRRVTPIAVIPVPGNARLTAPPSPVAPTKQTGDAPQRSITAEIPALGSDDLGDLFDGLGDRGFADAEGFTGAADEGSRLNAEAIDRAADEKERASATAAAVRLRALAEVLRGNGRRALELAGDAEESTDPRVRLTLALALASSGDLGAALRNAMSALATSRRSGDTSGEIAALGAASAIYRAAGRAAQARSLADEVARRRG